MTILGTGEMLMDGTYGETSPKQQRAIERLLRNGYHLQNLLAHAMTYIRLRSNALILRSEPVSILDILNSMIVQRKNHVAGKGLALDLVAAPGMPDTIMGDPDYLALTIDELITNALNFTPAGRVTVEIEPHQDQWTLMVQDTGIGMTSETVGQVFVPFWRGPDAKTYAPQGDGLGLTVVQGLVQAMGGTMAIQSQLAHGTWVSVRLAQVIPALNPPMPDSA
jgi:signal transduction histidine kinase